MKYAFAYDVFCGDNAIGIKDYNIFFYSRTLIDDRIVFPKKICVSSCFVFQSCLKSLKQTVWRKRKHSVFA